MNSENHTAQLGYLTMWAEMLRCTVHDIAAGIRIGALDERLRRRSGEFESAKARIRDESYDAVDFLNSPAALKVCDMFHSDPGYVLRKCMDYAGKKGVRGNLAGHRPPVNTDSLRKPKRRR